MADQPLGGTGGGGFAAEGVLIAGKQAELGEDVVSVGGSGGWAAPPSPAVSSPAGDVGTRGIFRCHGPRPHFHMAET